ncbi:low molecular weight protein-tyrosine-phosphatase [Inmirania thermothiophila]|uniref:protein-tyrosine-phosphatase n=1 Tax=Inmirania thermothiophila TaxID=1750597 RepID=A0A3N1Y2A4_9GAMM|nr:low molecular weight protein-tyrosine-phosphatase [Inmirania thermothiophila]ROR32648.1 protein-tyrosine phosphatase [Inmirania thermothiophila]
MSGEQGIGVLFVCMGNICRSPTAEGVFRRLLAESPLAGRVRVDSAGTHAYHVGEPPDPRAQAAAAARGIDLAGLRARVVTVADFDRFDHVLAMDRDNLRALERICPPGREDRLRLLMSFAPETGVEEVPDPYYGGSRGFQHVLDLVEAACRGLLAHLERAHAAPC